MSSLCSENEYSAECIIILVHFRKCTVCNFCVHQSSFGSLLLNAIELNYIITWTNGWNCLNNGLLLIYYWMNLNGTLQIILIHCIIKMMFLVVWYIQWLTNGCCIKCTHFILLLLISLFTRCIQLELFGWFSEFTF